MNAKKLFSYYFSVLLIAILLILPACDSSNETQIPNVPNGKIIAYSQCKSNTINTFTDFNNKMSAVIYKYSLENQVLFIKHINAGFNCCPGKITAKFVFDDDKINITEQEEQSLCDCNCLYDIDMEIKDIEQKSYYLYIYEPYLGNQQKIDVKINLKEKLIDTIIFERNFYPWGI